MPQRGRPHRGGNARHGVVDLRLRIDVFPLAHLDLVHAPHKQEHALFGDLHDGEIGVMAEWERKVGWKGQVGGPAGTASGAWAKGA